MKSLLTVLLSLLCLHTVAVERESTSPVNTSSKLLEVSNIKLSILDHWQLSEQEWNRYEELMKGIRGRLSHPNISPIEVLGIHARSDSERDHYARTWARMMNEDAIRVLEFQRAYDTASQELNEDDPLIDVSLLPEAINPKESVLNKSERVLLFLSLDCPLSEIVFDQVHQRIAKLDGIDVYFVDTEASDREEIREWAKARTINTLHVQSGKITINHDDGLLESIDPDTHSVPTLKRRKQDDIKPLRLDQLP